MVSKPTYTIVARRCEPGNVNLVYIVDQSNETGAMTVTNAADRVVADLTEADELMRIVYLDTDGVWSELEHYRGTLTGFIPYSGWLPDVG